MRFDNYTQPPPLYLQYWVNKTIIVNAVTKKMKSLKLYQNKKNNN